MSIFASSIPNNLIQTEWGGVSARHLLCRMTCLRSGLSKYDQLCSVLRGYGSCLVAYSGGVDSVLLASVARKVLGERMLAAIADSPSLPRAELAEARELAFQFDFPLEVLQTQEFENVNYTSNPANRCYFCKHELFTQLKPLAVKHNMAVIAYGENASDIGDYRPGGLAAKEFDVRSPLKEVSLTKDEIRVMSRQFGLPTSEKPEMPCLSSRIPYGEEVTRIKLQMIESAEKIVSNKGFRDVRVRHHEVGPCARVEIGVDELSQMSNETWADLETSLMEIGYKMAELDKRGYVRGNLNSGLLTR